MGLVGRLIFHVIDYNLTKPALDVYFDNSPITVNVVLFYDAGSAGF
jgi:hypothetical protein